MDAHDFYFNGFIYIFSVVVGSFPREMDMWVSGGFFRLYVVFLVSHEISTGSNGWSVQFEMQIYFQDS